MLGLSVANAWSCCRRHLPPAVQRNGIARQREKRVTQKWLDEYENREPIFCPWNHLDDPDEIGFAACNC